MAIGACAIGGVGEIVFYRFVGDLGNGGAIQFGRKVGGARCFVRELDDSEEAIAETAIFALDENGEGAEIARAENPEAKPPEKRSQGAENAGGKNGCAQPDGSVPKTVRDDDEQQAQENC